MRINTTRHKLTNGQDVYGVFGWIPSPESLEVCALLGYDWIMIDREHGPVDDALAE